MLPTTHRHLTWFGRVLGSRDWSEEREKKIKRRDRKTAGEKKKKKKAGRWHYLQNFHGLFLENN